MLSVTHLLGFILNFVRIGGGLIAILLVSILTSERAYSHHLLPRYQLDCTANFPCPDAMTRRIDFWIQVFYEWDKTKAILHDPDMPERVYAVVDTGKGCSSAARSKIKRQREKIKTSLRSVANKVAKKQAISKPFEQHIVGLFPSKSPSRMRKAAENIRCQSGVRDSFVAGLKRFHRYSNMVDNVLKQSGLPPELRYLPFVESSYNPAAYSKAGAAGMWQIMPATARVLGLELNATIDERLDPEAATRAAALYFQRSTKSLNTASKALKPNITQAEINPFIVTSYNYGVNGMRRAIKKVGPDYVKVLNNYKSPSFQVAVKNFYSSFLAASHLAANSDRYFGGLVKSGKSKYTTVLLDNDTSIDRIKRVFSVSESTLKPINPALTRFIWNSWRLIPAGYQLKLPLKQNGWQSEIDQLASLPAETVVPGSDRYRVRRGDTACGVARALGVNCRELIKANGLNKRATIRVGQKLVIPRKVIVTTDQASQGKAVVSGRKQPTATTSQRKAVTYRVKRGDSACRIAERYGISCKKLISANRLGRNAKILVGQKLTIPGTAIDAVTRAGLNENNQYIVRKGDNACTIAKRYNVSCTALKRANKLNKKAVIFPGQKLDIPGLQLPDTTKTAGELAQGSLEQSDVVTTPSTVGVSSEAQSVELQSLVNLLDTLPDLSVAVSNLSGKPVYTIRVEADETLGHFADWMGLRSSSQLRKLNNLTSSTSLRIGKRLVIPMKNANQVVAFEKKRTEYHQVLSESLKENFTIAGIESYKVKSGDSLWGMSNQLGFPLWLIYRLNPILRSVSLKPGQIIKLPKLVNKNGTN